MTRSYFEFPFPLGQAQNTKHKNSDNLDLQPDLTSVLLATISLALKGMVVFVAYLHTLY